MALALGRADVDRLAAELTASQLLEWAAYFALEPWGEARADLRAGTVAAVVAQVHATKGHRFAPRDFVVYRPPEESRRARKRAPTPVDQMKSILNDLTAEGFGKWQAKQ